MRNLYRPLSLPHPFKQIFGLSTSNLQCPLELVMIPSPSWFVLFLTFSVDWAVPKKIGTKASQMIQVVYMVKPIGLASLNVSGTPRLFTAYTVHVI